MARKDRTTFDDDLESRRGRVINAKGIGANAVLTAAAAIVPLVIVGVASVTKLADRGKAKRALRLPRR